MAALSLGARRVLAGLVGFNAVRVILGALAALFATRLLSPHDRGLMVLGTTISSVAALFVGMGTGSALRARLPNATGASHRLLIESFSWWSLLSALMAGGLAVGLSLVSAPLIDPGLADPAYLASLLVMSGGQVVLTQLPDAWYAVGLFRAGSAWAAGVAAAGMFGMLATAAVTRSAWVLLLGQGAAMLLAGGAQAARMSAAELFSLRLPARRVLLELPRVGARALGLSFGLLIALRMDRYMVGVVAGTSAVAVYSLASTLSGVSAVVPAAIGQLALREIAAGKGLRWARRAGWLAAKTALAFSVPVAVAGWLLIVPVFGATFANARPLLLVLLLAGIAYAPFEVASRGLLGGGSMGTAGLLGAVGAVAAVACYGLAVPVWGLSGAGVASLALYGALSVAAWRLLRWRLASTAGRGPSAAEPLGGSPVSAETEGDVRAGTGR